MAFCGKCGARRADGAAFCEECGAQGPAATPPQQDPAPPQDYGTPNYGSNPPQPLAPGGQWVPPGNAPPPGYGPNPSQYAPAQPMNPYWPGPLAEWGPRALGWLIDTAFPVGVYIVLGIFTAVVSNLLHVRVIGIVLGPLAWVAAVGVQVYFAFQIGSTGQSPGMRVVGLKCVDANSGALLGGGKGVVRWLAVFLNGLICYVGWLFPLWDVNKQTLGDKVMADVVCVVPRQGFSLIPPAASPPVANPYG